MEKLIDFYSGFEGEPEMRIYLCDKNGNHLSALHLWQGYFNWIIECIPPNENGKWEGITLYYHTLTGWDDGELWECENVLLFSNQLKSIDVSSFERTLNKVLDSIIQRLQFALENGCKIYFEEF